MKRELAIAAARRLSAEVHTGDVTEEALLRALAQIALGHGKPADRLRAIELLGKCKGMFKEQQDKGPTLVELVVAAHKGMEVKQ